MVKLLFLKFIAQVTFDFVAKKNKLCFNFHYSSHYNPLLLLLLKGGERERGGEGEQGRGGGERRMGGCVHAHETEGGESITASYGGITLRLYISAPPPTAYCVMETFCGLGNCQNAAKPS